MKRYRVSKADFDSRATCLNETDPAWEPHIRANHEVNRARVIAELINEFGQENAEAKIENFSVIGPRPFSVIAFHNRFTSQARAAFVIGAYYPALTATCALGERILNHLLLSLREEYKTSPEYKTVSGKNSFDNWNKPISALEAWNVLLPKTIVALKELLTVRNRSIHFDPATDHNDRSLALHALGLMNQIIEEQFPFIGLQPWFIPNTPGESYIKKEWEMNPFIRLVYVPNSGLVGPDHIVSDITSQLVFSDQHIYPQ